MSSPLSNLMWPASSIWSYLNSYNPDTIYFIIQKSDYFTVSWIISLFFSLTKHALALARKYLICFDVSHQARRVANPCSKAP
jgi:hypothetical protein